MVINKNLPTCTQIAFQIKKKLAVLLMFSYLESTKIIFHDKIQLVFGNLLVGVR